MPSSLLDVTERVPLSARNFAGDVKPQAKPRTCMLPFGPHQRFKEPFKRPFRNWIALIGHRNHDLARVLYGCYPDDVRRVAVDGRIVEQVCEKLAHAFAIKMHRRREDARALDEAMRLPLTHFLCHLLDDLAKSFLLRRAAGIPPLSLPRAKSMMSSMSPDIRMMLRDRWTTSRFPRSDSWSSPS